MADSLPAALCRAIIRRGIIRMDGFGGVR